MIKKVFGMICASLMMAVVLWVPLGCDGASSETYTITLNLSNNHALLSIEQLAFDGKGELTVDDSDPLAIKYTVPGKSKLSFQLNMYNAQTYRGYFVQPDSGTLVCNGQTLSPTVSETYNVAFHLDDIREDKTIAISGFQPRVEEVTVEVINEAVGGVTKADFVENLNLFDGKEYVSLGEDLKFTSMVDTVSCVYFSLRDCVSYAALDSSWVTSHVGNALATNRASQARQEDTLTYYTSTYIANATETGGNSYSRDQDLSGTFKITFDISEVSYLPA